MAAADAAAEWIPAFAGMTEGEMAPPRYHRPSTSLTPPRSVPLALCSTPLPPCGGGLGRGVACAPAFALLPTPTPARPRQEGGGRKRGGGGISEKGGVLKPSHRHDRARRHHRLRRRIAAGP